MKTYDFYKWRIWSILTFGFVLSLFHRSALGAISESLSHSLNLSASQLSLLASITFYTYALMQIPAGLLLDRFGYKLVSLLGIGVTGIGSVLLSFSTTFGTACLSRFLIGLGTSVIFIAILKAQKLWFSQRNFTRASGLLSFIGNIGGIIATFPLVFLSLLLSWQGAMLFMGLLCLVVACLIYYYVGTSPSDYGFEPRGSLPVYEKTPLKASLLMVFKLSATWRNFFVLFTLVGCTTTLTGLWGMQYLRSVYQLTNTQASFCIAFIIYGLVIGSLAVGPITTLFKGRLMCYPRLACAVNSCCWGYILFVEDGKPPLSILVALFFVMGFLAMSHIVAFTDILDFIPYNCSGLASSVVNSGEFIGSSLLALLIGFALDYQWEGHLVNGARLYPSSAYTYAFMVFFVVSLLGVATTFIRPYK